MQYEVINCAVRVLNTRLAETMNTYFHSSLEENEQFGFSAGLALHFRNCRLVSELSPRRFIQDSRNANGLPQFKL